jgi:hypothetical protein
MTRKPDDGEVTEVLGGVSKPLEDFASGQFRTQFASEAVNLSEIFKLLIGTTPIRGPATFHVEMSAPDGPSTGGGVQSVQHIKLVADDGGATLVAGWCDQKAETCELRTLDCLDDMHRARFKRSSLQAPPLPSQRLDRVHYGKLVERLRTFFAERDLKVLILDSADVDTKTVIKGAADSLDRKRHPTQGGGRFMAVLFGVFLGAAIAALAYKLVQRGR